MLKVKEKIMNDKIEKDNITFEKFNKDNIEHLKLASTFQKDSLIKEFYSEWEEITRLSIDDDTTTFYSYVVSIDRIIVGMVTLTFTNDEECVLSLGFLPKYRGKGNAGIVRGAMLDYLFSLGLTRVKGYIRENNLNNLKSVAKMGVTVNPVANTDLYEVIYENEARKR